MSSSSPGDVHLMFAVSIAVLIEILGTEAVLMGCKVTGCIYSLIERGFWKKLPLASAWHEFEIHFQCLFCRHLKFTVLQTFLQRLVSGQQKWHKPLQAAFLSVSLFYGGGKGNIEPLPSGATLGILELRSSDCHIFKADCWLLFQPQS